jgi:hypothetical protein
MDKIKRDLITICLYSEEEDKNRAVQKCKRGASP